jgi:predicted DNA-binding transcriptional regulator AlpA
MATNPNLRSGSSPPTPTLTPQFNDELLTVSDLALILRCKESSIYNLTRRRGRARYDNPVPVLRLPMGLRFKRSSVLAWLESQEQRGGVQ